MLTSTHHEINSNRQPTRSFADFPVAGGPAVPARSAVSVAIPPVLA